MSNSKKNILKWIKKQNNKHKIFENEVKTQSIPTQTLENELKTLENEVLLYDYNTMHMVKIKQIISVKYGILFENDYMNWHNILKKNNCKCVPECPICMNESFEMSNTLTKKQKYSYVDKMDKKKNYKCVNLSNGINYKWANGKKPDSPKEQILKCTECNIDTSSKRGKNTIWSCYKCGKFRHLFEMAIRPHCLNETIPLYSYYICFDCLNKKYTFEPVESFANVADSLYLMIILFNKKIVVFGNETFTIFIKMSFENVYKYNKTIRCIANFYKCSFQYSLYQNGASKIDQYFEGIHFFENRIIKMGNIKINVYKLFLKTYNSGIIFHIKYNQNKQYFNTILNDKKFILKWVNDNMRNNLKWNQLKKQLNQFCINDSNDKYVEFCIRYSHKELTKTNKLVSKNLKIKNDLYKFVDVKRKFLESVFKFVYGQHGYLGFGAKLDAMSIMATKMGYHKGSHVDAKGYLPLVGIWYSNFKYKQDKGGKDIPKRLSWETHKKFGVYYFNKGKYIQNFLNFFEIT